MRARHYSLRTEEAYVAWIRRFVLFHGKRHPLELSAGEVNSFLTYLAVEQKVSASTQTQALSALVFLYKSGQRRQIPSAWTPPRAVAFTKDSDTLKVEVSRLPSCSGKGAQAHLKNLQKNSCDAPSATSRSVM